MNYSDQRSLKEKLDCGMQLGAAVGLLAGAGFNIAPDGAGWTALFTTLPCGASGGIVGLLFWLGSPDLPEDAIPPVKTHATGSDRAVDP
jgi:hypothetical protein